MDNNVAMKIQLQNSSTIREYCFQSLNNMVASTNIRLKFTFWTVGNNKCEFARATALQPPVIHWINCDAYTATSNSNVD